MGGGRNLSCVFNVTVCTPCHPLPSQKHESVASASLTAARRAPAGSHPDATPMRRMASSLIGSPALAGGTAMGTGGAAGAAGARGAAAYARGGAASSGAGGASASSCWRMASA